jgi:hypothetical protein
MTFSTSCLFAVPRINLKLLYVVIGEKRPAVQLTALHELCSKLPEFNVADVPYLYNSILNYAGPHYVLFVESDETLEAEIRSSGLLDKTALIHFHKKPTVKQALIVLGIIESLDPSMIRLSVEEGIIGIDI